jgi:thioredoxin reductase (NADPH)
MYFARFAKKVTLLVRGDSLEASMSYYLIQQLNQKENVHVRTRCEVVAAAGEGHLQAITVCDSKNGMKTTVECGYLFVFIGAEPRTDWLGDAVIRDERGFVYTGPDLLINGTRPAGWDRDRDPFYLECSVPGIFAAGDVRANSVKRVASAVGEGAMAVTLVHRYLEAQ